MGWEAGVGKPYKDRKEVVENHIRVRELRTSLLREFVQLARATGTHVSIADMIIVEHIHNSSFWSN